jgi:polyisoprenoid-binding protein YceI
MSFGARRLFPVSLAFGIALASFCGTVRAQAPAAYQVDTNASRVYIRVNKSTRIGHEHGVSGQLQSGKVVPGGTGEMVFQMTSFVADTPQARQYVGLAGEIGASDVEKVNANMRGPGVLDVERFPTATYAITGMNPADGQAAGAPGHYQVTGNFTLHGVTQPVAFTATVEGTTTPGTLRMRGTFTIQQTTYGIQPFSALGGLVAVADPLQIWGDIVLVPQR